MVEFVMRLKKHRCEFGAMIGNEFKVFVGVVNNVYTRYVEIVEDDGKIIFLNQEKVTYVSPDV